jgi:hypothetical protein
MDLAPFMGAECLVSTPKSVLSSLCYIQWLIMLTYVIQDECSQLLKAGRYRDINISHRILDRCPNAESISPARNNARKQPPRYDGDQLICMSHIGNKTIDLESEIRSYIISPGLPTFQASIR